MKRWVLLVLMLIFMGVTWADVHVRGYFRSNGTYVSPHWRSSPNHTVLDNWSTKGNVNPYTGQAGSKNAFGSALPFTTQPTAPVNAPQSLEPLFIPGGPQSANSRWVDVNPASASPLKYDKQSLLKIYNGYEGWLKGQSGMAPRKFAINCNERTLRSDGGIYESIPPESSEENLYNAICQKRG